MKKLLLITLLSGTVGFVKLNSMDFNESKNKKQLEKIIDKIDYTCKKNSTEDGMACIECIKTKLFAEADKKSLKAKALRTRLNSSGKLSQGDQLKAEDYETIADALEKYANNL